MLNLFFVGTPFKKKFCKVDQFTTAITCNELFQIETAGEDLEKAVLILMNRIKNVPNSLLWCNISALFKMKGKKSDFENYRGVFRITILRFIQRVTVENVIMQGTVWGTPSCVTTLDPLAEKAYNDPTLTYKYKGSVAIPPLMMVDDVVTLSNCGTDSVIMNSTVNAFINTKKLKLSTKKCSIIHIQKERKTKGCLNLKVNGAAMNKSKSEKYLGDYITTEGTIKATIKDRINKSNDTINYISAILMDVPLGSAKIGIGLKLRTTIFTSKLLLNSESWQSLLKANYDDLGKCNVGLLKNILNAHSKTLSGGNVVFRVSRNSLEICHLCLTSKLSALNIKKALSCLILI